MSEIEVL